MHPQHATDRPRASPRRFHHIPALDGVHGIAVILVVASHLSTMMPDSAFVARWAVLRGGFLGVDLFFVLSGFLITALLLNEATEGGVRLKAFYARRALRLLPALYLFLVGHVVFAMLTHINAANERRSLLSAVLYVSNRQTAYDTYTVVQGIGHLWSLAVEEQFYLVWPLVLLVLLRLSPARRALPALLLAGIATIGVHRALLWHENPNWLPLFVRTDTRADTLLFGALGAVMWHAGRTARPDRLRRTASVAALVLGVILLAGRPNDGKMFVGGFTVFALAAMVVVLAVADAGWGRSVLTLAPLRNLGKVSYGLYLWHALVFDGVARWIHPGIPVLLRLAIGLGISAAFTAISYQLVERPALRLKRRFERHPAPVEPAPG